MSYRRRSNSQPIGYIVLVLLLIASLGVAGYWWVKAGGSLPFALPSFIGGHITNADVTTATSDVNGLAHLNTSAGAYDFQVISGLTGERLTGVQVSLAVSGS